MEYLIRLIFVLVCMDSVANLEDPSKVGGQFFENSYQSFAHRKWRLLCQRREVNRTPHLARVTVDCQVLNVYTVHRTAHDTHAQTFLARGSSYPRAHVMFRTMHDPAPFSATLNTPTSSSASASEQDKTLCTAIRTPVWPFCRTVSAHNL